MTNDEILSLAYDLNAMPEAMTDEAMFRLVKAAVSAEREACAQACEEQSPLDAMVGEEFGSAAMVRVADAMAKLNATAIRARSEQ